MLPQADNAQRTRKRRSRTTLSNELLKNWVVSRKQRPNGRLDKALPCEDKTDPSTSVVPEDKPEGEKETEEMKSSSDESDIDLNDLLAFSQLIDVPKTIIDRFDDE
ncbi:hypothetical protein V6N11_035140 [Hibiscus sabdariffa]|uniref:Uncharacterized protein n=1 Tax=Hibiscus sabdariffa TaxID=183260 RepID=A0ABR2QZD3_9ROSI